MANKKITDVDIVNTINDADYLFVNQNSAIRQIKKSNIIKDISVDTTLSVAGQAADAKATGDAISSLSSEVDTKVNNAIIEKVITENTVATSLFNFWANKKGGCLGDSISEGYHTDKTFYTVTKELLNMSDFINYGISGSCIGGSHANAMSKRYTQMSDDLDVIVVAGGVNDMGTNIDLGNINSTDETTFYGALKVLCEGLINKYPTKQIIFITPSHIGKPIDFYDEPNARGYNLKDYANAIIEVCGLYSIPVFDGYRLSGIYPENTVNRTVYTHDGLHWNTNGHYRVGLKLAQFMLFGCIPNQTDNNGDGEEVTTYTITNNLSNATNSNVSNSVESGHSYNANISANSGYVLSTVSVVMNSNDITSSVYSNGVINIPSVTGNVIITVVAVEEQTEPSEATLTSIEATYSGGDVTVGTSVNSLNGIVVTANYDDGTSKTVTGYTLSGSISEGSNTITVTYRGKTTTFTVNGIKTPTVYTITNDLTNVSSNNSSSSIEENNSYMANLSAKDGYILDSVTVTMGGVDITSTSYSDGTINISKVTGNIIIIAKAIAEVVSYVGKTMTLNGFKNMGFHIVPLIAVDEDAVSGNVVKHVLKISNPINIVTTRGFSTTGFGDNTGEVSNSAYSGTYGGNTSLVATQEDGKYVFTIERTLTGTPTQPYLKFPMGISFENGNPPGSFVIEDIKTYVNGIEKPILKLGGFWKEETFTLS